MKKTYILNALQSEESGSFPILRLMAEYQGENEEAKVLVFLPEREQDWDRSLVKLSRLGIQKKRIKTIRVGESRNRVMLLEFMKTVLEEIPEESEVYIDITHTSQLISAVLIYAMNLAEKLKNCEIEKIMCKEKPEDEAEDLSVFKLLGDVADQMQTLGICRKKEAMEQLFL